MAAKEGYAGVVLLFDADDVEVENGGTCEIT